MLKVRIYLAVSDNIRTFATEIRNSSEDNLKNNYKYGNIRFLPRPTR